MFFGKYYSFSCMVLNTIANQGFRFSRFWISH